MVYPSATFGMGTLRFVIYFIITLANIMAVIVLPYASISCSEHCVPRSFCFLDILPSNINLKLQLHDC